MSFRDDFSSNMNSPGNYSASGTYGSPGYKGGYGGTNNPGMGFQTRAQANAAASMSYPATNPNAAAYMTRDPIRPPSPIVKKPLGLLSPPVTQEEIPGVMQPETAPQGIPWTPQRYVNPGYGMDPNGIGRTVTPRTAPQGYFGPRDPSFTPAGAGGWSSYKGMGNDFRSTNLGNGPWSPR